MPTEAVLHRPSPRSELRLRQREVTYHTQVTRIPKIDDQFLDDFVVATEDGALTPGCFEFFDLAPAELGPGRAVLYALEVMSTGFQSLQELTQTIETRMMRQAKYRSAMRELRESLSSWPTSRMLFAPVFLFAVYEVKVTSIGVRQEHEVLSNAS